MKVIRINGHIGTDYVDVRFTTDMQSATDENFNIVQIQEGKEFNINDKKDPKGMYLKYLSPTFQETNNSLQAVKAFADSKSLNVRIYNEDQSFVYLTDNQGLSNSNSKI